MSEKILISVEFLDGLKKIEIPKYLLVTLIDVCINSNDYKLTTSLKKLSNSIGCKVNEVLEVLEFLREINFIQFNNDISLAVKHSKFLIEIIDKENLLYSEVG